MREITKPDNPTSGTSRFPVGHVYEADFSGVFVFQLHFDSGTSMTFTGMAGKFKGSSETETITVTPIRPGVIMVSWQEKSKNTVVHVHDYENGNAYANSMMTDNTFIRLKGH